MQSTARLIKTTFLALSCALVLAVSAMSAQAADADKPAVTVFKNVKVFNGTDDELIDADVLVEGNLIKQVGKNLNASGATPTVTHPKPLDFRGPVTTDFNDLYHPKVTN